MSQKHSQNERQATEPIDQEKVENMQEETTNLQDEQPKEAEEMAATDKVADELAELQKKYDGVFLASFLQLLTTTPSGSICFVPPPYFCARNFCNIAVMQGEIFVTSTIGTII